MAKQTTRVGLEDGDLDGVIGPATEAKQDTIISDLLQLDIKIVDIDNILNSPLPTFDQSIFQSNIIDSFDEAIPHQNSWSVKKDADPFWVNRVGETITGDGRTLKKIVFYADATSDENAPTGPICVKMYAHSGTWGTSGIPTGDVLATSVPINSENIHIWDGSIGLQGTYKVEFYFDGANQIVLSNGTHYVAVIDGSTMTGGIVNFYTGNGAAGNFCYFREYTSGHGWQPYSSADLYFYVITDTVKIEPITGSVTANAGTNLNTSALLKTTDFTSVFGNAALYNTYGGLLGLQVHIVGDSNKYCEGTIASGAVDADFPVKIGGLASTSAPTAVDVGDVVNAWMDLNGRLHITGDTSMTALKTTETNPITAITANPAVSDNFDPVLVKTQVHISVDFVASQTGATVYTPTGGKRFVVTDYTISFSAAGKLTVFDNTDSATTHLVVSNGAISGGNEHAFKEPYRPTAANNVWKYTTGAGAAGTICLHGYEE